MECVGRTDLAEAHDLSDSRPALRDDLAKSLAQWFRGYQALMAAPQDFDDLRSLGYVD